MKISIEPLVDSSTVDGSTAADATTTDPAALPSEWSQWAEEPGQRVTITDGGHMLGVLHFAVVGAVEGWMEGLWVQPAARGRGVGRRLVEEAEDALRGYGVSTVRTAIPSRDYAALAVAEKSGFNACTEANVLIAEIEPGPIDIAYDAQAKPAEAADAGAVLRVLGESPLVAAWRGLVPLGWRFRRLQLEMVKGLINDGRLIRSGETVEGAAAFAVHGTTAVISFLEGPRIHCDALFGAVAEHARNAGADRIALFTPERDAPAGVRATCTPHPWCPDGLVIVEKSLSGAPKAHGPVKPRPARPRRHGGRRR